MGYHMGPLRRGGKCLFYFYASEDFSEKELRKGNRGSVRGTDGPVKGTEGLSKKGPGDGKIMGRIVKTLWRSNSPLLALSYPCPYHGVLWIHPCGAVGSSPRGGAGGMGEVPLFGVMGIQHLSPNVKNREERSVHDHHRKKIIWGTFLASKKNFPGRWWMQEPYENQKSHIYHRNLSSVAPIFLGKEKFRAGAGRCMLSWKPDFLPLLVLTRRGRSTGRNQYW